MKKLLLLTAVSLMIITTACKKGPGTGGKSKITGKIWVMDYNTLNSPIDTYHLKGEYAGADESVYIIYGDDVSYSDKVKSGPDGTFEFPYLRAGDYKVYLASR